MELIEAGAPAPDFRATIQDGSEIKLSDFKGKYLILYFYPKDNTPGCTVEAQEFGKLYDDFKQLNAHVIGVSRDSVKSHANFCTKHNLKFDLISDGEAELCQKYKIWQQKSMFGKKYMGIQRATFLIGPSSEVLFTWPSVSFMGHAQQVLDKLKEMM